MPLILLEKISKHYHLNDRIHPVLNALDLVVNEGEWVTIVGDSGSGKSTLMHILGLLDQANSGIYRFQGQAPCWNKGGQLAHLRNRAIGFVFQAFHLLPRLSVVENVALPLWYQGLERRVALRLANTSLEPLYMQAFADHKPHQLSGGQQQRVAIARALVTDPALLLADEPTGALDRQTATDILQILGQLHQQGKTLIMVSHDPWVAAHGSRIIQLVKGRIGSDRGTLA